MSSSTSTSKRWLLFYLASLLLAAGIGWVYASRFEPETQFWVEVFKKRRTEIAQRSDEPHILFTGDSACSFGIDVEAFQEASGTPAFNLGGTRQMGMRIFMEEALQQARKGDTIVLICNPNLLISSRSTPQTKAGAQMALALPSESSFPEKIQASRPGFNHLITLGAKAGLRHPIFAYNMTDYHRGGQISTDIRITQRGETTPFSKSPHEVSTAAETLHFWAERSRAKEVTLKYLLPLELTDPESLAQNRAGKKLLLTQLAKEVSNMQILSTANLGCSDDPTLYSDTLFHLTEEGATEFSKQLAATLQR